MYVVILCVLSLSVQGGKAKAGKKAPLGPRGSNNGGGDQTVEQRYQKKTQLEHILLRPDTYSELLAILLYVDYDRCGPFIVPVK